METQQTIKIFTKDGSELNNDDLIMGMKCDKFKGVALTLLRIKVINEILAGFKKLEVIQKMKKDYK